MGKKLDDLDLGESGPGEFQAQAAARDLNKLEVRVFRLVNQIDAMLLDPEFQFARATLESISKGIQARNMVTEKQAQAIENIRQGGLRHGDAHRGWSRHEKRTGRRYDP